MHPYQQTFRFHVWVDAAHESREEEVRNKLCKIKVHIKIYTYLYTVSNVEVDEEGGTHIEEGSRTDLYSHANMPVLRHHAYII